MTRCRPALLDAIEGIHDCDTGSPDCPLTVPQSFLAIRTEATALDEELTDQVAGADLPEEIADLYATTLQSLRSNVEQVDVLVADNCIGDAPTGPPSPNCGGDQARATAAAEALGGYLQEWDPYL